MQGERKPAVAGLFYDKNPAGLRNEIDGFLSGVKPLSEEKAYRMVVSPHAGYRYSGKTAAHAIGSLKKAKTFIILGPNHSGFGARFSVMSRGSWVTPLGRCEIDGQAAGKLKECDLLTEDSEAHSQEHSIEVQLPLMQQRFGAFSFVPISMMNFGYSDDFLKDCRMLGKAVAEVMKSTDSGLVASSDFSHYLPIRIAQQKDRAAISRILKMDDSGFFRTLKKESASVCGFGPIAVAITAARQLRLKPEIISKSSSGDETGEYDSVVTYYAVGFR